MLFKNNYITPVHFLLAINNFNETYLSFLVFAYLVEEQSGYILLD
jgi:hypothetical protein